MIDQDESWGLCQYLWQFDKVSSADEVDTHTCEGGLDKGCYDAIKRQIGGARGPSGSCPTVILPKACDAAFGRQGEERSIYEGYRLGSEFDI